VALLYAPEHPDNPDDGGATAFMHLSEGPTGTAETLDAMVRLTKVYRSTLPIRQLAERIINTIPGKSYYEEVMAVRDWVRDNIRYTQDVYDVETLQTPLALLNSRQGDCDDQAMLVGALLQSIGKPIRYRAIGLQADQYDHVYAETRAFGSGPWISVETTENVPLGWQPQYAISMVRFV
jgi:transglutaminase-like putative cysteine protease